MPKFSVSLVNRAVLLIAAIGIGASGWFVFNGVRGVDEGVTQGGPGFSVPLVAAEGLPSEGMGILSAQAALQAYH